MVRGGWKALFIATVLVAPQCSTDPPCSNHSAPHATFDVARGCVGYYCAMSCDNGFADCNASQGDGCETSKASIPAHTVLDPNGFGSGGGCGEGTPVGTIGQCSLECEPGFFDCDHSLTNGCETSSIVGCFSSLDGGPFPDAGAGPERIATIGLVPFGLVACAGAYFFFAGQTLGSIDASTLTVSTISSSPAPPIDGLACDGTALYWSTASPADAASGGALYSVSTLGGAPQLVASGFDPSPGIDERDGGIFVMSSAGVLALQGDAGLAPWTSATATGAYKPFTLGPSDTWSIAGGAIVRRADDAGPSAWIDDAGAPSTIVTASGEPIASIHASFDDAGPVTDWIARLEGDGGAALTTIFTTPKPIVATASGAKAIVASDDTIYVVAPPQVAPLYTTKDHVVDVATDGKWVVWTTRGQGGPAGVFRGLLP